MNNREKILTWVTMGLLAVGMSYVVFYKAIIEPIGQKRTQKANVIRQTQDLNVKISSEPIHLRSLRKAKARTFGSDDLKAQAASRTFLMKAVGLARLESDRATITPLKGSRVTGGREIGWLVRVEGSISRLVDLLYLLQEDRHIHQVKNVGWRVLSKNNDLELKFSYMTLVLEDIPDDTPLIATSQLKDITDANSNIFKKLEMKTEQELISWKTVQDVLAQAEEVQMAEYSKLELPSLRSRERAPYELIASRDIFRPYIKRPPPPPPPPPKVVEKKDPPPTPPRLDPLRNLRLVGLTTWEGEPEVSVLNVKENEIRNYKVGEDFIGGEIMLVDYRMVTHPDDPLIKSPSRLIVRIKDQYWAVEIGQYLSQKRILKKTQWPVSLQKIHNALQPANNELETSNQNNTLGDTSTQ